MALGKLGDGPHGFPALGCDSHCHIFGPPDVFPYAENRPYTPDAAPLSDYRALQARLGLTRAVFVQPACHGHDHSAVIDAVARSDGHGRAVGLIRASIGDEELSDLDRAGLCGARFNFVGHLGAFPQPDEVYGICKRIAGLGWHATFHVNPASLDAVRKGVRDLPIPFVIDHFGRIEASRGTQQAPFRDLLRLLEDERCWIKISAADRISAVGPPYADVAPFARALIATAPDRILWGTDWPHPNVNHIPDDEALARLLMQFAPEESLRRAILVDNPARLYRFAGR